jgi:ATP-dependent RNA helicase DeaD
VSAHFHRKPRRGHRPPPGAPRREKIEELHPIDQPPKIESFEAWPLGPDIQRGIAAMDISVPTPIQALAIGPVLEGRDVIAKAETGTGKTLAFGAPMMARIDPARATVLGLVLCPTRELAQQVHGVLATLGLPRGIRTALTVGGDPLHPQIAQLQAGAQVVVGTPGRVLDLYQQRFLSFPWTEYVVLDEADKMFEIGFLDDIKRILSYTPPERQTLLFSATFPTEVLKLAREATRDPLEVATARGTVTVDSIDQRFIELDDEERPMVLIRLIEQSGPRDVFLVFCARRTDVDRLMRRLERQSFSIKALHGGYDQASRFRVMSAFRTGEVKALVATDVASRGLDVQHVTHVVNFSVPRDVEDYTHRIGRTGRAGRSGTAITFVVPADRRKWRVIFERTKGAARPLDAPGRTGARRPDRRPERGALDRGEERVRSGRRDEQRRPARGQAARPAPAEPAAGAGDGDRPPRRRRRGGRGRRGKSPDAGQDGGAAEAPLRDGFGQGI